MGKGEMKKATAATQSQVDVAREITGVAKGLMAESAPARQAAMDYYMALLKGNRPEALSAVAPQVNQVMSQTAQARKAIEAMPPGGARDKALRDLALQEAALKTQIYSGSVPQAATALTAIGQWGTQTGLGGYGQASQGFGSAAQMYGVLSNMKAQGWGSLAGGIGALAGGKL